MFLLWLVIFGIIAFLFLLLLTCILVIIWINHKAFNTTLGYVLLYNIIMAVYIMYFGIQCLPHFTPTGIHELDPLGRGWNFMIQHYKSNPQEAAALVLMSEIVRVQISQFQIRLAKNYSFVVSNQSKLLI